MGARDAIGLACHFFLLAFCVALIFGADSGGPFLQETLRPFASDALKLVTGATLGYVAATFGGR